MSGSKKKTTKKKMNIKPRLINPSNTVCFMGVENFDGVTMYVNPKYLKEILFALTAVDEKREDVQIGISDSSPGGIFLIFLDVKCEMALGVAGLVEK